MTANDIDVRQNQPDMIRYLAAQRQLYSEEKRCKMIWYVAVAAIALAATGLLPATGKFLLPVTALVFILAGLEIVVLPLIGHKRVDAAGIQELFDCEVLQMERNKMLADGPNTYLIDGAVDRFNRRPNREEAYAKLSDWYSGFTPDTPLTQARLICQKMNLGWDEDVRHEWKTWLYVMSGTVVILSVLLGLFFQWTVATYFTGPFVLLIPLVLIALKAAHDQDSVRRHLGELNQRCEYLLRDATHIDVDETAITQQSRQLQDEIYRHRSTDTTVPDFIYERVRKRRELRLAEHAAKS